MKRLRKTLSLLLCAALLLGALVSTGLSVGAAETSGDLTWDAETLWDKNAGNPIFAGYIGDPFMFQDDDGTFYVYGTTDGYGESGIGDLTGGPYCVWYSKDLVNWKCQTFDYEAGTFPKDTRSLWAPSVTKAANGKYYMAYIWSGYNCYLASADSPLGPWVDELDGNPIAESMFDTDILTLSDGHTYVFTMHGAGDEWGIWIGKFKDDMSGLDENGLQFLYTSNDLFEGPGLFEENGKYYLTYSNGSLGNGSYHVNYAVADNLYGPYTKSGTILKSANGLTTTGHNSTVKVGDDWYIVYHYKSQSGDYARLCGMNKITFNADGTIVPITPTVNGERPDLPLTMTEPNLAANASATASSVGSYASLGTSEWKADYAVDNNNGTLWQASSLDAQFLKVDLGEVKTIGRIETFFEYHTVAYRYRIEYSTDGETWQTYSNRMQNQNLAAPQVDSADQTVQARYLRYSFPAGGVNVKRDVPVGIWEIQVYEALGEQTDDMPEGGIVAKNLVENGDFEDRYDSGGKVDPWTFDNMNYGYNPNLAYSGSSVLGQGTWSVGGTATQTIVVDTTGTYTLSGYYSQNYQPLGGDLGDGHVVLKDSTGANILEYTLTAQSGSDDKCTIPFSAEGRLEAGTYTLEICLNGNALPKVDAISLRLVPGTEELPEPDPNQGDRAVLDATIAMAKAYTDESKYPTDLWTAFQTALTAANGVAENADQATIDAAQAALEKAIAALAGVVDRSALEEAIEAAEALDGSKYTDETWQKVEEALAAAKTVPDDADQDTVDDAAKTLKDAISSLIKKPLGPVETEEIFTVGFEGAEQSAEGTYTYDNVDVTLGYGGSIKNIGNDAYAGTNVLHLGSWGRATLAVDLKAGETYRVEGYYRNLNDVDGELRVWLMPDGSSTDDSDTLSGENLTLVTGVTDYTKFSVDIEVPADYTGGYLLLKWQDASGNGVYVDAVSLLSVIPVEGPQPGDVNGDNAVNSSDARAILQMTVSAS